LRLIVKRANRASVLSASLPDFALLNACAISPSTIQSQRAPITHRLAL
jgi:hypothetical protein